VLIITSEAQSTDPGTRIIRLLSMKVIKSPAAKMGVKECSRGILINAPEDAHATLYLPEMDIACR
jgi:hypothetical protein